MSTDLHDLMDRALDDLDVPTDRLREESMTRGRAVRRRRRAAALIGGAAVVALVAGITLPAVSGTDDASDRIAHDSTSSEQRFYEPPPGWWDMPSREMRDRLATLLPEGRTITATDLGNDELGPGEKPHGGWVLVDLADRGEPAGAMNVLLYPPAKDGGAFVRELTRCTGNLESSVSCTELSDADGNVVGRSARSDTGDVVVVEVTRLLPDGGIVYVAASNSSDDKWGSESSTDREQPAASAAEVRRIAEDPVWQAWTPQG